MSNMHFMKRGEKKSPWVEIAYNRESKTLNDRANWPTKAAHIFAFTITSATGSFPCSFFSSIRFHFSCVFYRLSFQFPWIVFMFGFYHLRCAFNSQIDKCLRYGFAWLRSFHWVLKVFTSRWSLLVRWIPNASLLLFIMPFIIFFSSSFLIIFSMQNKRSTTHFFS